MPTVAPEPPAGLQPLPTLKKPVPLVPTPMKEFDPTYVERRKQITEKFLTLKNGRQLAYFTEGSPTDPAVLCLHSLGQSKMEWLFKEPLPGVFQIAVDRQGHGNSTPYPPVALEAPRQFSTDVAEYVELLDALGVDKFYVTGSSMGGSWTIALAASLPDRCLGAAPISALASPWHSSLTTTAQRKRLLPDGFSLLFSINDSTCSGSLVRKLIRMAFPKAPTDRTVDPGFAKQYNRFFKYGTPNSKKLADDFAQMDADPFFVSRELDAHFYGGNCSDFGLVEQIRVFCKQGWGCDPSEIRCPTFIYQGALDAETPLACAEHHKAIIPGAQLVVMPDRGHVTILMRAEEIILALVQGKAVAPS